jgi:chromo domain-containing protein 1
MLVGLGDILRKQVRLWSIGVQEGIEYDAAVLESDPEFRHDCIEIFPVGGFIYITDDVFEKKPQLALKIIKLFFAKIDQLRKREGPVSPWQEVDDAGLLWRLCVRPELMEYLIERCEGQSKELEAGDPDVNARAELYVLLSDTNYIEQDDPVEPLSIIPDKYPVLSERRIVTEEQPVDYFNTLSRSQEEANLHMIRYYAGLQIDMRRDYRHFFVVHTDPSETCVNEWKAEIQTIADVITPAQCVEELGKDGEEGMFNFCEQYMPELNVATGNDVVNSQVSLEDGEIRSAS